MAYTYHELKEKTVGELRDIAKETGHDDLKGAGQMNKEHLLPVLCRVLGVDTHEHHVVVGIDKPAIKARMRELKKQRDAAVESHDHEQLKRVRRQLHRLNRQIRAHMT
jgi:protein-arginine kinase activator protein McsA